jgi:hypothetical protein
VNVCPDLSIDGVIFPLERNPKILGVIFHTMLTFCQDILAITAKATQRLNILKDDCGSSWGHNKETLLVTYRALVESFFNYATAIWFPDTKTSNIAKLQFIQFSAMHLITGCHKLSSIAHLHAETKLLPVAEHLGMLCTQFLAGCLQPSQPSHPSHEIVLLPPGPRKNQAGCPLKETLSSRFHDDVGPYLSNGIVAAVSYNRIKDTIHTTTVLP